MPFEGDFHTETSPKESIQEAALGVWRLALGASGVDQTLPHAIVPIPLYGSSKVRLGSHGKDCQPLQAQGVYLPVERNLRWTKRLLGLRATRNRVEKEPEGLLVAPHGEGTGRCRRHGRFDPDEPPGLGCERTRKYVYRSDG